MKMKNRFFGLFCVILYFLFPAYAQSQCGSTSFPDQWAVHELETSELPYRSVYIYADFDIDGDGRKDIVTGQWWYRNPGSASGNWVRNTIGGSFRNMAHIHDFDGDGDLDLLGTMGAYEGSDMVWAENNGTGSFTIHSNIPSGDTDFGEPFLAGISGANFQSGGPYQMTINWNGAEATDSPVQMLTVPADPINTQWPLENISSSSLGEDLQKGDIDGDGDLDLFQSKNWLRNNGNGTWTAINTGIDYVTTPDRAQLADFNGDGDLDAVVGQLTIGTSNSARMEFAWFEAPSNPEQNWTRHLLASDINGSLSVFAEDIDLDGDDDIIVGEWKGNNRLIAFENDLCDSGTWIRHTINAGGTGFDHHDGARVVDIDNDGDFDIVSIGWDNIVPRIFENTTPITSNDPPNANAGADQEITLPTDSVVLNGSGSDPDGGSVTFQWTQTSGPNTATLAGEDTEELNASGLVDGEYVFRLMVTDDEDDTDSDEIMVTVNPEAIVTEDPIADAGADQEITLPLNSITLSGSGSDPDGGNVTFQWTQTSGPNTATFAEADTEELGASGLIEGEYIFRLTVTDDEDDTDFDEIIVTVNPDAIVTEDPIADAGVDQEITLPVNSIILNGSGSDPDGGSVTFQWTQTSGPNTANLSGDDTEELNASGLIEGEYVFSLTVTDDEDDTDFDEIIVTVNPEAIVTENPISDAGADQEITLPLNSIELSGSGSDPDGGSVTFQWTQTSGPNTANLSGDDTEELNASGLIEGEYVFRLTVTDDEDDNTFDELIVRVGPEASTPNTAPQANALATVLSGEAPLEVAFNPSNSTDDQGIAGYNWDFGNEDTSTEINPVYTFETPGTYQVTLTVTDAEGLTGITEIIIMVTDSGIKDTVIRLEVNPTKEGIAKVLLINQPADIMVTVIYIHDSNGQFIAAFNPQDVSVEKDVYEIPIATLSTGVYYIGLEMSNTTLETIPVLVTN